MQGQTDERARTDINPTVFDMFDVDVIDIMSAATFKSIDIDSFPIVARLLGILMSCVLFYSTCSILQYF